MGDHHVFTSGEGQSLMKPIISRLLHKFASGKKLRTSCGCEHENEVNLLGTHASLCGLLDKYGTGNVKGAFCGIYSAILTSSPGKAVDLLTKPTGAPNDGFHSDPLKRYFRLPGVPLKLCRFILGCAIIFLSVRSF